MEEKLAPTEQATLEWISGEDNPIYARRARLLLLGNQGLAAKEIAPRVELSAGRVRFWLSAFRQERMDVFPAELLAAASAALPPEAEEPPGEAISEAASPAQGEAFPRPKSPGVRLDDPMSEAGRKVLRFHFDCMLEHEAGTRLGEDIEELHDMRVATRRMRSAFRVFAPYFDPDVLRPFLKGLRRTGRALGRVRDLDVFMEKAQCYLLELPQGEQAGLDPLLAGWREERRTARAEMLAFLDGKRYRRFVERFGRFLSKKGAGSLLPPPDKPTPYRVYQIVPAMVYSRYEVVRGYERVIENAPLEMLHALRIDCKRLRYTLEFFREVLGPEAKQVIKNLVDVQDHLGDLHDADVACQLLIHFLDRWSGREQRERVDISGVTRYLAAKQNELRALVDAFPKVWQRFYRPKVRRQLALAVAVL